MQKIETRMNGKKVEVHLPDGGYGVIIGYSDCNEPVFDELDSDTSLADFGKKYVAEQVENSRDGEFDGFDWTTDENQDEILREYASAVARENDWAPGSRD
jgi:hypothetical protein